MSLKDFIWYERYRPSELDQLILPPELMAKFEKFITEGDIPHLLLFGAHGSGKTTIASILMDKIPCQSMKLNASSKDRNLETVRGKIRDFAASMPLLGKLKVVFMDEADGITPDAQRALKNTIESYSGTCRFLFTANHINKIIPEIRSRFMEIPLQQVDKEVVVRYIEYILGYEEVEYQLEDLVAIVDYTFPDIRSTFNTVQAASLDKILVPSKSQLNLANLPGLVCAGNLGDIRRSWAGTADFLWMYKMLFDVFIPQHIQTPHRPTAALRVAEYLYRDGLVADKEINAAACLIELMQIVGANVQI